MPLITTPCGPDRHRGSAHRPARAGARGAQIRFEYEQLRRALPGLELPDIMEQASTTSSWRTIVEAMKAREAEQARLTRALREVSELETAAAVDVEALRARQTSTLADW